MATRTESELDRILALRHQQIRLTLMRDPIVWRAEPVGEEAAEVPPAPIRDWNPALQVRMRSPVASGSTPVRMRKSQRCRSGWAGRRRSRAERRWAFPASRPPAAARAINRETAPPSVRY